MLTELRLRNVAVIDAVSLPLADGLNVLSGETGAGKSLIVGALSMLLGERASPDRVREGTERAVIEGTFLLGPQSKLRVLLDTRGIESLDDVVVIKREIGANGRSRAWINGSAVTAAVLAEIGAQLVSVHGQHDSRQLLEADHQRAILDAFGDATPLAERVTDAHARCAALVARQHALEARLRDVNARADYLRFVVRDVDNADPQVGEDDSLDGDLRRLRHAADLRELASQAANAISDDDSGALGHLGVVRKLLASLERIDPETAHWGTGFDGARYVLQELARELEQYAESIDADVGRLRALESRRALLHDLTRKYGPTIADVIATRQRARDELTVVDTAAVELREISGARDAAAQTLAVAAAALSERRVGSATRLAALVTALLPELGMPEGRFSVILTPFAQIAHTGAEAVAFAASLNAGTEPRPLARMASGGELSRLMLALSTVIARLQEVPTLVFDEVDAGIGGAIAWQVGALMRRVASHHQVLAISHLAQIAARAHHHIVVQKCAVGTVTAADTTVVTGDARVREVARMLGGDADREVSRAHARELIDRGANDEPVVTPAAPPRAVRQRRGKPV